MDHLHGFRRKQSFVKYLDIHPRNMEVHILFSERNFISQTHENLFSGFHQVSDFYFFAKCISRRDREYLVRTCEFIKGVEVHDE